MSPSVAGGREHHAEAPLGAFASRWQLNERSRQVLAALPQEVLNTVMAEFRPAPGTASVDGKLQTFARGVLERFQEPQAAGGSRAVADFVARWGLDAEAGAFLESLPEGPLSTVLSEFSPRAGTRNVVGKLRAFAGTVLEAQGFGGLSHESLGLGGGLGLPGGLGLGLGGLGGLTALGLSLGGLRGQLGLGDHAFLQKWGLADNELAKEALQVLTPEVKARLVRDFQPAPGTVDVAGKFLSFAQSVARGRPVRQVQPSSLAMRPGSLGVGAVGAVGPGPAELEVQDWRSRWEFSWKRRWRTHLSRSDQAVWQPCGRLLHDVWSWNFNLEWDGLLSLLKGPVMVALDTEFPGFLHKDYPFADRNARYMALRENVDFLWPIQFGLAVADEHGGFLGAWTFNLSFDLATNLYSEESIRFLHAAGVDFPRHAVEGIDPAALAWRLGGSPLVGEGPEWVTFSGWYDWGYLLKLLIGRPLPYDVASFDELLAALCPVRHELRDVLPRGSLDALLGAFGLERLGPAHTAGSDALATLELYLRVRQAPSLTPPSPSPSPLAPLAPLASPLSQGERAEASPSEISTCSEIHEPKEAPQEQEPPPEEMDVASEPEAEERRSEESASESEAEARPRRARRRARGFAKGRRSERMLKEQIVSFMDISDNEVWEPVLKVFHATGAGSLCLAIAVFTLLVFSGFYLLL
ncbi:unnamed protein product [Effrenium voratum]|nr:unnamed protein product [Effrenium voratum]